MRTPALLAVLWFAQVAWAQQEVPPPSSDVATPGPSIDGYARTLKRHFLSVRLGWGGIKIVQSGQEHDFALMDPKWMDVFERVPAAEQLAVKVRSQQVLGMGLTFGGLLAEIGAGVLVPVLIRLSTTALLISLAVSLAGATVAIVGAVFLQRAQSNFTLAAEMYNAGLINEGLLPEERIDLDKLDSALPPLPPSLTLARF